MRQPERILVLSSSEYRQLFYELIHFHNKLIQQGKYTDAIDELLKDCFHYMLYQEAIMRIFSYLGIEMKDSYDTIKKISKKKIIVKTIWEVI